MTVLMSLGKLRKKVGIPVAWLFLIGGIAVWFIPAEVYYDIGISEWMRYGVNTLASLAGVLGCMITSAWVLFED